MQLHEIILLTTVITTYNRFINALGDKAPVLSEQEYSVISKSIHENGYLPIFGR
jgi:hypothetical protein